MSQAPPSRAFSLIELLVVIGVLGLLMAMVLPGLSGAREQGRRTACLANLHSLGQAATAYATDEPKELIIPIHQMMVTYMEAGNYWLHRTAIWFAYGGRSAPQPFLTDSGPRLLNEDSPWAAQTRPLNRYLYGDLYAADEHELKLFRCPSDAGYPLHVDIDDSPPENADRPCYETLGNSYRASLYGMFYGGRSEPYSGAFAIGPWGHRLSTIESPAQVAVFGEPRFFNMIGLDYGEANPDPVAATGWHRRFMVDNLVFCDGAARPTRATGHETLDPRVAMEEMGVGVNWDLLSRGPGWRFDLWPTPGAHIWMDREHGAAQPTFGDGERLKTWPFAGAQDNLWP
jgi:prepilin-type N-terminal cleavage/methylation domain-containing protein